MTDVKISQLPAATTPLVGTELVPIVQSGVTKQATVNQFGAAVGYTPAGTGAVATTVQTKLRESVSVKDFGAVGNGVADDTAAIQAARDWLATTLGTLYFPPGIYVYSVSPNWAIHHAEVQFAGNVTLRYTGTGNAVVFDASAVDAVVYVAGLCYQFKWGWISKPNIECPSTAQNAVYVRSCHHAKIGARVRGAGTTYAGLRVQFAVCTEFDVVVSGNEDGWYLSSKPYYGYYLDRRNPGETTSYCTFVNPIVEGPTVGIHLERTLGNVFIGGTSEACSQYGVFANTNSSQDRFFGTDFEVNTTADLYIQGTGIVFDQCDTYTYANFGSSANGCQLIGGRHSKVLFDIGSSNCVGSDFIYNRFIDGSTMQDAGTANVMRNIKNFNGGTVYLTGSATSAGVVGVANGTTTLITGIAVPGCKLGDAVVASYSVAITGFSISAWVSSDGFARVVFSNNSGGTINLPAGTVYVRVIRG